MKLAPMALCSVLWLSAPATLHATVIFDGFGPGDSFEIPRVVSVANDDVVIGGNVVAQDSDWALAFETPGQQSVFQSLEIALSFVRDANEVDIFLRESAGGLPGALIESFHLSGVLVDVGSIHALASTANPVLAANTRYWIEMSAGEEGTNVVSLTGWQSSTGNGSPRARQFDEGAWQFSGFSSYAYRVNANFDGGSVPEPTTLALMSIAMAGFGFQRRRSA